MSTEAHKRASINYNKRQDSITIRPNKEIGTSIRAAAQSAGMPLQAYILQAVQEKMKHDSDKQDDK